MVIPLSQLQTWSNRPDSGRSADTYSSIKRALDRADALKRYKPDVYLQGSYANATNIRADSDVDVVAELTASFRSNKSEMSATDRSYYASRFSDSSIRLSDFRRDVLAALRSYYGSSEVSEGNKCLKVAGSSSRLAADVLPCQQYRLWRSVQQDTFEAGIIFQTRDGRDVINFPKQHRANGQAKHGRTDNRYKGLARAVKNARRRLVEDGKLTRDVSPSYFVECLLYNIPDPSYVGDVQDTYHSVLQWLNDNRSNLAPLKCQNGITQLFGNQPEQWDTQRAGRLITALIKQWNDWNI